MKRPALLLAALALQSGAGALSVQLFPFDFQTAALGGGYYSLLDRAGLKVTAYSEQPQVIAPQPGIRGKVILDLNHLPSKTQKVGPNTYIISEQGVTLTIQSAAPLTIEQAVLVNLAPPRTEQGKSDEHRAAVPLAVAQTAPVVMTPALPPAQATPAQAAVTKGQDTVEIRNHQLARLPGLPREITGSVNVTQTQEAVTFSYSLINLGSKSYSLDVDDLALSQDGHSIKARLERKNGSLSPGLLASGKGEIGRIIVPRISSAPIELRWTLRSGDTTYTLNQTYTPE